MCCIFTCCGWVIDLVQRLWTFTMACCISLAVCCSLLTASMSGVALGYNYSLAEYIDLKETNVSVFLKRGMFDDQIADDMDWRRAGHMPVAGHINEDNLVTGEPADDGDLTRRSGKSGRRMDDNIYQSDDQNRFEGSLMKLTAKPLDPGTTTPGPTSDVAMGQVARNYKPGTINQIKEIQSLINRRKFNFDKMSTQQGDYIPTPILDTRELASLPAYPGAPPDGPSGRRAMYMQEDSLRNAVPGSGLGQARYSWINPKLPPDKRVTLSFEDEEPTYPRPVTPRPGPLRPTRPVPPRHPTLSQGRPRAMPTTLQKSIDEERKSFRDGMNNLDPPTNDFMKLFPKKPETGFDADYEDDVKGLPVRKRRAIKLKSDANKFRDQTSQTKADSNVIYTKSEVKEGVSESMVNGLGTVLINVKDLVLTTVSENSSKLNVETSTRNIFVKLMT